MTWTESGAISGTARAYGDRPPPPRRRPAGRAHWRRGVGADGRVRRRRPPPAVAAAGRDAVAGPSRRADRARGAAPAARRAPARPAARGRPLAADGRAR